MSAPDVETFFEARAVVDDLGLPYPDAYHVTVKRPEVSIVYIDAADVVSPHLPWTESPGAAVYPVLSNGVEITIIAAPNTQEAA